MVLEAAQMQVSYTISKDSEELGPFTVEEVLIHLSSGKVAVTDFIYLEDKSDWVSLLEFPPVINYLKSKKPKTAPKETAKVADEAVVAEESLAVSSGNNNEEEWFILREEKKLGPYTYIQMVKMLQDQDAYEFDYVWNGNMAKWMRIAELREFSPERMQALMKTNKDVFNKRQHKRFNYNSEVMVSDHTELFSGNYIQLSEAGAKVKIACSMLSPGDKVVIHHKQTEFLPAFNAECEVVNKAYSQVIRNKQQEVEYTVRFLKINDTTKKSINALTQKVS